MSASVNSLLEPISADSPCGEDIGYDPKFVELDSMLQGKPETQFAAAEEPDWKAVMERCQELFNRSKDLRVAIRLCLGLLKTEGLPGFRDGMLVLTGLIERYWETVYPRLDPDDGNDPLERVNICSALATPVGTFGDPLQFLVRLRQAPLCESSQLGRLSLADVEKSNAPAGEAGEGAPAVPASQIQAAFRDTPADRLLAIYEGITGAQAAAKQFDELLTKTVGANRATGFDALHSTLKELRKCIAPYAAPEGEQQEGGEGAASSAGGGQGGSAISGSVRSTQDVVRVLDQICEFYRKTEPSSPVPLILERARRLVNMDFVQLLTDLAPESLNQINVIAGIRPDAGAAAGSGG